MTYMYNVFGGMLNLAESINQSRKKHQRSSCSSFILIHLNLVPATVFLVSMPAKEDYAQYT